MKRNASDHALPLLLQFLALVWLGTNVKVIIIFRGRGKINFWKDCSSDCKQCASSTSCSACESTHFLYEEKCIEGCPPATAPITSGSGDKSCQGISHYLVWSYSKDCSLNCEQCVSSTSCNICASTYFLYQSECTTSCPFTTFPVTNPESGNKCESNYKKILLSNK